MESTPVLNNEYPRYSALSNKDRESIESLLKEIQEHTPWRWEGSIWDTPSKYWSFLRGNFRRIWSKSWVFKNQYLQKHTFSSPIHDSQGNPVLIKSGKNVGGQKTQKHFKCEITEKVIPVSKGGKINCEVDHISPAGSCVDGLSACIFLFRLLTSPDNMRLISKDAHKIITHMERTGMSWEEAKLDKAVIAKMKQKVPLQIIELASNGFSEKEVSNKDKRKKCYIKMLS